MESMLNCRTYESLPIERAVERAEKKSIYESYDNLEMTFGSPFRRSSARRETNTTSVEVPPELLLFSNQESST